MMIQLMHFGYQHSMQKAIKRQEKLKRLKTIKMNGKDQKRSIIGLQVQEFDFTLNYTYIISYDRGR